jgi:tRNA(Arg) A34 adenosine deaminase TadA
MTSEQEALMRRTIELAVENVKAGTGGPFSAIIVRNGKVIATGVNKVTSTNDPTAHAEVVAIREACQALGSYQLDDCEIFASCEPCPMCLGAIYWARVSRLYFACSREDAAAVGFDDAFIYGELGLAPAARSIPGLRLLADEGQRPFAVWAASQTKIPY